MAEDKRDKESTPINPTDQHLSEGDKPKGFFSDPKNVMPLISIIISVIGTTASIY